MDDTEDQPYPQLTLRFIPTIYASDVFVSDRIASVLLHSVIINYARPATWADEFKEAW